MMNFLFDLLLVLFPFSSASPTTGSSGIKEKDYLCMETERKVVQTDCNE